MADSWTMTDLNDWRVAKVEWANGWFRAAASADARRAVKPYVPSGMAGAQSFRFH